MTLYQVLFRKIAAATGLAMLGAPVLTTAQESTSREVVQPLPSAEVQRLNRALLELARRPRALNALLDAADASLEVNDIDAAAGFYGRAADLEPDNPQVKLGLAQVYLRSGSPIEALPLFNAALVAGASPGDVLSDQALAFDLVGDQSSAQAAYGRAIELRPQDDEARRRLALSHAISGNEAAFQTTLAPLLESRDMAAFRARAFGLAILGQQQRAEAIVNEVMPRDLSTRINPYLAYMPRLTPAQQAAAANLGIFPRAADIGREDPRIARFAREGAAGSRLEPSGEAFGNSAARETVQRVAAPQPIPQSAPTPAAAPATTSAPTSAPVPASAPVPVAAQVAAPPPASAPSGAVPQPGFDLGRSVPTVSGQLPAIAVREAAAIPPAARQPAAPAPANVADAFADLGGGELPVAAGTGGAVNIAAIDIPREVASEPEPAPPVHPRRIWVQLATGRDTAALRFDWRRMQRNAPDLLGRFTPHVTPWGQANRLLAGPVASREEARTLINSLAEKGLETFSYISPEGTEIQELK